MKKLRLLVTEDCNRNCKGCCNNDIKPEVDIKTNDLIKYIDNNDIQMVLISGGEPMLYPDLVNNIVYDLKTKTMLKFELDVILYTADCKGLNNYITKICDSYYFDLFDGITITLHEQEDVRDFYELNKTLLRLKETLGFRLNYRLNIFSGIVFDKPVDLYLYNVKFIDWIKNCLLPENEVLARLVK